MPLSEVWWQSRGFLIALSLPIPVWVSLYVLNTQWQMDLPHATTLLPILLMQIVIYPILEECVFRGLMQDQIQERLQTQLQGRFAGVSLANCIVSLSFALCHYGINQTSMSLAVFFPSLVFGALFDHFKSVKPGICIHIYYNLGFLCLLNALR